MKKVICKSEKVSCKGGKACCRGTRSDVWGKKGQREERKVTEGKKLTRGAERPIKDK